MPTLSAMAIIVNSPFSGEPVKVRDQDAGRAVRDEEGRIFYVLPRSDGNGYYGSITRAANTKDEQRALEMESKLAVSRGAVHDQVDVVRSRGGRGLRGKLVVAILAILVAILAYLFGPWGPLPWFEGLVEPVEEPVPSNPIPLERAPAGFAPDFSRETHYALDFDRGGGCTLRRAA